MGEWIIGAIINVVGSIGINFGTNLLKLGHKQRERLAVLESIETGRKVEEKSITKFRAWRLGIAIFSIGNCLNFVSFGYAAQSLLAALGSVQFISNVAFAYLVLKEIVTGRIMIATGFIVVGNIFLVSFGNHQSKTYSHQELLRNYIDRVFLIYVFGLLLLVLVLYFTYRKGREMIAAKGDDGVGIYWHMLLPFSYAMVSGIIGTQSVLFAKSLSILLRLTVNGDSQLNGWFTYVVLTLFIMTAAFWMIRLNQGLAMFDAILIVPMLQIVWTFFSIFTGFVYFEEYQVFNSFKASMFGLGVLFIICGMFLLSPRGGKEMDVGDKELQLEVEEFRELKRMSTCKRTGQDGTDRSRLGTTHPEFLPLMSGTASHDADHNEHRKVKDDRRRSSVIQGAVRVVEKAKTAYELSLKSSVFSMPMLASSRITWRTNALMRPSLLWFPYDVEGIETDLELQQQHQPHQQQQQQQL